MISLLISLWLGVTYAAERTVYVEKATLFSSMDPGYTWKNCIKPTTEAESAACDRRKAWPVGGERVNIRAPTVMRNGALEYAIVEIEDSVGWVNVKDLDPQHKRVIRDSFLTAEPGEEGARIAIRAGEVVKSFAPPSIVRGGDTYYFAEFQDKSGNDYQGWIAGSAMSKQLKKEIPDLGGPPKPSPALKESHTEAASPTTTPPPKADCKDCGNNPLLKPESDIAKLNTAIQASDLWMKDSREFEKFACYHSKQEIYKPVQVITKLKGGKTKTEMVNQFTKDQFCDLYAGKGPNFREQIKKASKAFALPEAVIGCMLMIESALFFNPKESDEYRGLAQFGRAAVEDLRRYVNMPEYKSMWTQYAPSRPLSDWNDTNIRLKSDVEMQVGAVAYYAKWLLTNRLPLTGCKDCSKSPNRPNRKDLYMTVAGYNWSPYGLGKIAHLSVEQMKTTSILRGKKGDDETPRYFEKMDRCLEPNQYEKFTHDKTSGSYRDRGAKCDEPCP